MLSETGIVTQLVTWVNSSLENLRRRTVTTNVICDDSLIHNQPNTGNLEEVHITWQKITVIEYVT